MIVFFVLLFFLAFGFVLNLIFNPLGVIYGSAGLILSVKDAHKAWREGTATDGQKALVISAYGLLAILGVPFGLMFLYEAYKNLSDIFIDIFGMLRKI